MIIKTVFSFFWKIITFKKGSSLILLLILIRSGREQIGYKSNRGDKYANMGLKQLKLEY